MGDWTSVPYVISQVLMVISHAFFAWTFFTKKRLTLLLIAMSANLVMGVGYGFLFAWVGVAMCCIALARDSVNYLLHRKNIVKFDFYLLPFWIIAMIIVTYFTASGWLSYLALIGTIIYTVSIWQKSIPVYRIMGIFVYLFWIGYNIYVDNLVGIILRSLLLVAAIISLVIYFRRSDNNHNSNPD